MQWFSGLQVLTEQASFTIYGIIDSGLGDQPSYQNVDEL